MDGATLVTDDTVVIDDPSVPNLPIGCIGSRALRSLADTLDSLETWHHAKSGIADDKPCLRRIESANGTVTAHISIGHIIGAWEVIELGPTGWKLRSG